MRRVWREGGLVMGIWKQCHLAESRSGERTNVCLMWDCPGHVIAVFYEGGGYEKTTSNALSCGLKLGSFCLCVNVSLCFLFLPLHFPPSLCLPLGLSLICTHIEHPPTLFLYVFVLLCLVSVREERVKGTGPLSPQGTARGSQSKQGSSLGAPPLLSAASAPLIALWDKCSDMQYVLVHTHKQT